MGTVEINREAFEVGLKGWDWSMGSIQYPWYAGFHLHAARMGALFSQVKVNIQIEREIK